MNLPDIYIIGSGNVAWHITHAFSKHQLPIKGIWSRNTTTALQLSSSSGVSLLTKNELKNREGIFFLIVNDSAIEEIASELYHQILIHCAGSIPLSVLEKYTNQAGVFYPLQTFSVSRIINFSEVPILLESSNNVVGDYLVHICNKLSCNYHIFNSEQRLTVHIAAVFANNFSNLMLSFAQHYLSLNQINPELLHPLIQETFQKAIHQGPLKSQTGPAIRQDINTIKKHLTALENIPELKKFYSFVTEYIQTFYSNHE